MNLLATRAEFRPWACITGGGRDKLDSAFVARNHAGAVEEVAAQCGMLLSLPDEGVVGPSMWGPQLRDRQRLRHHPRGGYVRNHAPDFNEHAHFAGDRRHMLAYR